MGELNGDNYYREICDVKMSALADRIKALEESYEEIIQPGSGHIAVVKSDLEKRMDQQDSKLNGLIMTLITAVVGTAIAIGGEFIKKFVN